MRAKIEIPINGGYKEVEVEFHYTPYIPPRCMGHPDNWQEGIQREIEIGEIWPHEYEHLFIAYYRANQEDVDGELIDEAEMLREEIGTERMLANMA